MKKLLPTIILVLILAAGSWYAKSENFFREEEPSSPALFNLESSNVSGLKLAAGEETIELQRNGDGWDMVKPAAYPVEKLTADGVAQAFGELTYKEVIEENPGSLAEFGLEKPVQEVEAIMKDGSSRKLMIGNSLPVAGTTYIKMGDTPTVYEVEDSVLTRLTKTTEDFLDKTVLKLEYDQVKSIELEWKGEKWTLTKSDLTKKGYESAWKLGDKELMPEEGSGILDKLTLLSTDRLPKACSELQWDTAQLKLTVKQDNNGTETVLSYSGLIDNELVRIAKSDGPWAFAMTLTDIQAIADQLKQLQGP